MNRTIHIAEHRRRGSMVPALAMALLTVGLGMALVFDRLWLDAAVLEMRTAGEAAALAAANRLASDDTLKVDADSSLLVQNARTVAAAIAAKNTVCGNAVGISGEEDGDVDVGRKLEDSTGEPVFVRTNESPNCIQIHLTQRGSTNPAANALRGLSGSNRVLATTVEATAENNIAGVRPFAGAYVPILPIAIASGTGASGPQAGWTSAVESRLGPDTCGVPTGTRTVAPTPDGLPELTVMSAPKSANPREQLLATLHVFDVGRGLGGKRLAEQCRDGWSIDDLAKHNGEFILDGKPKTLPSTPKIPSEVTAELTALVGQARLCVVYDAVLPGTSPDRWNVVCRRLVAVRILAVQELPDNAVLLQLQPAVVVTRTAIVEAEAALNPYIYKVSLTN